MGSFYEQTRQIEELSALHTHVVDGVTSLPELKSSTTP
jgi:hypothetical protein